MSVEVKNLTAKETKFRSESFKSPERNGVVFQRPEHTVRTPETKTLQDVAPARLANVRFRLAGFSDRPREKSVSFDHTRGKKQELIHHNIAGAEKARELMRKVDQAQHLLVLARKVLKAQPQAA